MSHAPRRLRPGVGLPLLGLVMLLAGNHAGVAQIPTTNRPWNYLLLTNSSLTDDCLICGRPTIIQPMQGTFELRLVGQSPIVTHFTVENVSFVTASGRTYRLSGSGTFAIGGEVSLQQLMFLQLEIDDGITNKVCYFTNTPAPPGRIWPMLDVSLVQTNGTFTQQYSLRLAAAPVRELWFSTIGSFVPTAGPDSLVRGGDLVSTVGRIVKRNADLFTSVGAFPPGPDLGLDAVDILPGGEIAFSLKFDITSTTLGQLHHGDLLSTRGRILQRNQELMAAFGLQPPAPDVGLDAVQVLDSGEILFSIGTNIFSERLGVTLHRGDLLSNTGLVVRSNQQLLSNFHPPKGGSDYGLDALHVWSSGEIWFSTEQGFQDDVLGAITDGDLLSDQGYIVFLNGDLVKAFAPAPAPAGLGLDALYVITDAINPAPAPRLSIEPDAATSSAALAWMGQGRVFQVEKAPTLPGVFQALSPIVPDLSFKDLGAVTNRAQGYYRLRQW